MNGQIASTAQSDDERFMRLALALGRRNLGHTWPNPAVGAVVVKDGVMLARGWTQDGGRPHAEAEALRRAKKAAQGATMYVSLEPCSHEGKTPPCADAIIRAGIARVVSTMEDPNPDVAGKGHERLRAKGITVDVGLGAEEARHVHAGHITRVTKGRPHVTLKLAISADGKAGLAGRKPAAISGETARERVFQIRAASDAILVGIGTVLSDDPQLTCRLPGMFERSPVRVVLDEELRLPLATSVVATVRETPTWVFTSHRASAIAEEILQQKGCKVFRVEEDKGRLDLNQVLAKLAEEGITRCLVEGGPIVASSLVAGNLVDEAILVRGEKTIGETGIDPLDGMPLEAMTGRLTLRGSERLATDTIENFVRG
ncbi:MAG TPA: bifunctional diaminohydroxyphosphoribosylaminopyrimidine deaminase/5-amino-6-(5-phosphoribosylamino)uracil reductase RibD [Pseudolabrys sp.]|nr:bifunctional diaminohydroxyphosphoribosylaminopyrimidine deaminase/5-amino-6-(5-phosphoribosylamino)uracil reductase RibD [Pseudolabrys sp.]